MALTYVFCGLMGLFDRFRTPKKRTRLSKYNLETLSAKNELITALKDALKAKDFQIQAYKKALGEVMDLEENFDLKSNEQPLGNDADLVDIITSTLTGREDIPRPLKQAISSYADAHRPELNSVLNQKVNQLMTPAEEKKESDSYGL